MLVLIAAIFVSFLVVGYIYIISGKATYVKDGENRRIVTSMPSQAYIFAMAVKKSLFKASKNTELPKLCLVSKDITLDSSHIEKYRYICGFSMKSTDAPLTYPYLIIFSLQALLLVDKSFPFQAMGLVHLANRIQQFATIASGSKVTASVKFDEKIVAHDKGYCFIVISEVFSSSNQLLWRCESTYLYRTKVKNASGPVYESKIKPEDIADTKEVRQWDLKSNFGRAYAAISGDYNPIHLYGFTAKLFGFPHGCIMHGMWSIGACVAEIIPGDAIKATASAVSSSPLAEVYVELKMPMYLPARPVLVSKPLSSDHVHVKHNTTKSNAVFEVMMKNKKDKEFVPHLRGTCSWN